MQKIQNIIHNQMRKPKLPEIYGYRDPLSLQDQRSIKENVKNSGIFNLCTK